MTLVLAKQKFDIESTGFARDSMLARNEYRGATKALRQRSERK
jgi:hypothetical protein